ncbi:NAD(P)/FAD-dependent oxidoreductase [Roseateles sp.]|uniref:NAD(P)/FAD-dependent oxidoreductase n=1 Tax=Roseateles sp. TaxID=1971397 RepID=UPI0032660C91
MTTTAHRGPHVAVIGGGFAGLSAAWQLAQHGVEVTLLEAEPQLGGLAANFEAGGEQLERFYHHWFLSDTDVLKWAADLGLASAVTVRPTRTAVYHGHRLLRLSTPWDLLTFRPLRFADRLRLARLMLRVRRLSDWSTLDSRSARDWLLELGGPEVYRVVWEPLLKGKFGADAERISAVWMWNKLKLRGGSRGRRGEERLAYLSGGFSRLSDAAARSIGERGGRVRLETAVSAITPAGDGWSVECGAERLHVDAVLLTPAPAVVAGLIERWAAAAEVAKLRRIRYLANLCLVLELDRALTDSYWLNINDPDFPFVGVIEHTNFESASSYGGRHVVYLSRYLPVEDPLWSMPADEVLEYAWKHLTRLFPQLERASLLRHHVWRARWAQPIVEAGYRELIPATSGTWPGLYLCNMAQIYPEDRGTNQAVRDGRRVGDLIARDLQRSP